MHHSEKKNFKHAEANLYNTDPQHSPTDSRIQTPHSGEPHSSLSFYDEIRAIWEKSGFKRHRKPSLDEKIQESSTDFSFSPYDNFF